MTDANEELRRLKEAERSAHDRFRWLSGSDGIYGHPEIAGAAKRVWKDAFAAVLDHEER